MGKIKLVQGDITKMDVECIVNAANSSLMGGGGVDGAIHRAAGPALLEECVKVRAQHGQCHTGTAVITGGGNLKAGYVIHTVGPVWNGGANNEAELLSSCYRESFKLAAGHGLSTVAFPNISTGVFRFPKELAGRIATQTVKQCLDDYPEITEVYFVCFDDENYRIYEYLLAHM